MDVVGTPLILDQVCSFTLHFRHHSHSIFIVASVHPDLDDTPEIPLRTFAHPRPSAATEFLESPIGAAFLEWNSRVGVPRDVWCAIITAYIRCNTCRVCRSFNGDIAHRDAQLNCNDAGQAALPAVIAGGDDSDDGSSDDELQSEM